MRGFSVVAALLAALAIGAGEAASRGLAPDCAAGREWRCDSGECIPAEGRCDGRVHCGDASDETAEHCIHLTCPRYAFRCAYGACLAGVERCNGVAACADGSDETDRECGRNPDGLERKLRGNCSDPLLQMQCSSSGECVDVDRRCDGAADCADGSDESVQLCSHLSCPAYAFRCGYGGCVRGSARCDGQRDCFDGSDEAAELCGYERPLPSSGPGSGLDVAPKPGPASGSASGPRPPEPPNSCSIPFHRRHLQAADAVTGAPLQLGSCVAHGRRVLFSCAPGSQRRGAERNECRAGRWRLALPHCTKFCSGQTLARGASTVVACERHGRPVDCKAPLAVGTRARVSCAPGYRLPAPLAGTPTTTTTIPTTLTCDADAEWDFPKMKCEPECGVDGGGDSAQAPWHVELFRSARPVCAGAVVSPRLLLTAASCFLESDEVSEYHVLLGPRREPHNVSEILFSPPRSRSRRPEVAVLVLGDLLDLGRQPPCRPICLPGPSRPPESRPQPASDELLPLGPLTPGQAIAMSRDGRDQVLVGVVGEADPATGEATLVPIEPHALFLRQLLRRYRREL